MGINERRRLLAQGDGMSAGLLTRLSGVGGGWGRGGNSEPLFFRAAAGAGFPSCFGEAVRAPSPAPPASGCVRPSALRTVQKSTHLGGRGRKTETYHPSPNIFFTSWPASHLRAWGLLTFIAALSFFFLNPPLRIRLLISREKRRERQRETSA